jgi:hypothetical protein
VPVGELATRTRSTSAFMIASPRLPTSLAGGMSNEAGT